MIVEHMHESRNESEYGKKIGLNRKSQKQSYESKSHIRLISACWPKLELSSEDQPRKIWPKQETIYSKLFLLERVVLGRHLCSQGF